MPRTVTFEVDVAILKRFDLCAHMQVIVVPGRYFSARSDDPKFKCKFVRMAFANRTPEELQDAACRFSAVLDAHEAKHRSSAA